jgi:hypothetical protein
MAMTYRSVSDHPTLTEKKFTILQPTLARAGVQLGNRGKVPLLLRAPLRSTVAGQSRSIKSSRHE